MKKAKLLLVLAFVIISALLISSCAMLSGTTTTACTAHVDRNKDGKCDKCSAVMSTGCDEHIDEDHDGECDECGEEVEIEHVDKNKDCICDECEAELEHVDKKKDGICDRCKKNISGACLEHIDEDHDGECDECGEEVDVLHIDENEDGLCDVCDADLNVECDECVDSDGNLKCDKCGKDVEPAVCQHKDENYDAKCDECAEAMEGAILLYDKDGLKFNFVLAAGTKGSHVQIVDKLIKELKDYGITVTQGEDKANSVSDYEVIFNPPTNRGDEYKIDPHVYGAQGYAVQVIGTKIIVVSGSDDSFQKAVNAFKEGILGITEDTKKLGTRYIYESSSIVEIQDDYKVNTITLFGEDIRSYTIAADKATSSAYSAAQALQSLLYGKTGYWLEIVPLEEAGKSIVISLAPRNLENDGYSATFTEGRMDFIAEYPTVIQTKTVGFFTAELAKADGTLNLTESNNFTSDVRYVYYRDYGAVGDGETDDSEAIRAAHVYANQGGHKVIATAGARYYIGKMEKTISVRTDVDWLDATFLIDDSKIKPGDKSPGGTLYRSVSIFTIDGAASVSPTGIGDLKTRLNKEGGIDASTFTSFNFNFGQPLLIRVSNSNHKNYIRYGVNENSGASQEEVVLVDAEGNIDPTTTFMFDFEQITSFACYPISDEPITIEGGKFYTSPWLQDTETSYTSYSRGIKCSRSNVTFKNIKHYLINEGSYNQSDHRYNGGSVDYGCPYGGFFTTKLCDNTTYYQCQAAAHITYWQVKSTGGAGMGTYDIDPGDATNIVYEECYQEDSNFFDASGQDRWGVMGSSGNKNVTFLNSKLTRFDAHNGVHNVYIIGSTIKMIRVDGTGTFLMQDSIHYTKSFFGLREDYGGFWHGNVILKNNKIYSGSNTVDMFNNTWYNHYFGYPTAYPTNIIIDGLEIYNSDGSAKRENPTVNIFSSGILTGATKIMQDYLPVSNTYYADGTPVMVANVNQTPPPERVIIRNCEGITWVAPSVSDYPYFRNTIISINEFTECNAHFDLTKDGKCDDCGADFVPCTEHVDRNNDGICCFCFADVEIKCDRHVDKNIDAKCDICHKEYVCPGHLDEDGNRICDICGGVLGCKDGHGAADSDGYCKTCKKLIPKCTECVDTAPHDNKCDKCKAQIVATITPCEACVDSDSNKECDVCHKYLTEE